MNYINGPTAISDQIAISNFLFNTGKENIISEIKEGLVAEQKYISSKFFYDDLGSKLFEDITRLPEYYPTRTEKSILLEVAPEISKSLRNINIVELGNGDCSKITIILDAIPAENMRSVHYIPVDVSHAAIMKSAHILTKKFPDITIHGVLADFMKHIDFIPGNFNRLICFFGSTLGNLTRVESMKFLLDLKTLMNPGDQLLLGLDMVKDIKTLENAYNDEKGVTSAFNKNILNVVNYYLKTSFNPDWFEHLAFYNKTKARIEMHLKALKAMEISCPYLPDKILIKKGETIHTENSHKYTKQHISDFANIRGLKIHDIYSDNKRWFSIVHFVVNMAR